MPITPTATMTGLAARRLQDTITIREPIADTWDVDPDTGAPISAQTGTTRIAPVVVVAPASVKDISHARLVADGVIHAARDVTVWVPRSTTALIMVGQIVEMTLVRDASLVGQSGSVVAVERDSLRAVGRIVVRLESTR